MVSILLIEDDPAVRLTLSMMLEDDGYVVTSVDNGAEGLARLLATSFDFMVTDIWMPKIDGVCVIQQARRLVPNMPILAVTGGGASESGDPVVRAQRMGSDAVMLKPFKQEDLLLVVKALLQAKTGAG
ncbi:Response regulatory domain-containing protein [Azospirillaceae bacterium]